jgi:hypothetical protein
VRKHGLDTANGPAGSPLRIPPGRVPIVPGLGIHVGFGGKDLDEIVVHELIRDARHRLRKGGIHRRPIGRPLPRVTNRHRLDERAFGSRNTLRLVKRGTRRAIGRVIVVRVHRRIDVGAERERFAPEAHRAIGIEFLGVPERAGGFAVIEAVQHSQSLVEIGLGLRVRGGDLHMRIAKPAHQRRWRLRLRRQGLCIGGRAGQELTQGGTLNDPEIPAAIGQRTQKVRKSRVRRIRGQTRAQSEKERHRCACLKPCRGHFSLPVHVAKS